MRVLKPIVAEVSPNLYSAAMRANLNPTEQNQIEQMSWAVKKNKELSRMDTDAARKAYEALDPNAQEGLKVFFGTAEYMQAPPDFSDRLMGALKFTGKVVASPLLGLFKVAGAYNRAINTPYLVARQIAQGESIFDAKVWDDAWEGKNVYDNGALAQAVDRFGKSDVFIAQGLLAGKKPGEILDSYGKLTPEITASMEKAFNNPEAFKQVMDATKYAQVSPGRDIARMLDTKPPKNGGLAGDYIDGGTKNLSGVLDFIYQIAIDPLTWITGGTSKAATRGTQLAELVTKAGDNVALGVSQVFKDKSVLKLWDEQLGPQIERLASTQTEAEKAIVRRDIGRQFPGYNNDEALNFFAKNKMFNANQAEKIFADAENTHLLLSGRIDGMIFRRNGVVTARRERRLTTGLVNKLDEVFNSRRTAEELQTKGEDIWDGFIKSGEKSDLGVNPNIAKVVEGEEDFKKGLRRIGTMAARNPAGQMVLTGDDAIKTIETVRQYARLVVNRDMADFIAMKFLKSTEDEQIVVMRNLYAAIMQRAGITDKAIMEEYLKKTHNGRAGFTSTVDTKIDPEFAAVMSKEATENINDVNYLSGSSAIQPSQIAAGVGPLPLEEIALRANEIKSKQSLIKAAKGATGSRFAKNFVDTWTIFTLFPRLGIRSAVDEGFMYAFTAPGRDLLNFLQPWRPANKGRSAGRAAAAYTGRSDAEGIGLAIKKKLGGKTPSGAIDIEERNKIIEKLAVDNNLTVAELDTLRINTEIADRASIFLKGLDEQEKRYWTQAMVHQPDVLNSMANSIAARTSLGGRFDEAITGESIKISELTRALNEGGKKVSGKPLEVDNKYNEIDIARLVQADPSYLTLAHFDNWYIRFATPRQHGKLQLADGFRVSPAVAFFSNKGLKTPEDFTNAVDDMMKYLGMKKIGSNVGTKSIPGGNAGKGTPLGDAKDIAMRNDADAAIVELENIERQKEIVEAVPNAVGKSSTETSLLQLGPITDNLTGKTIMLARNGKLANQPLRKETIQQIKSAKEAGAKFIVGDMPGVDSAYYKILDEIQADYIVYHTGASSRVKINTRSSEGTWQVTEQNIDAAKKFLSYFGDTVFQRQKGLTDNQIIKIHIERMLMDMKDNFHGSTGNYNQALFDAIARNHNALVAKELETGKQISNKWQKAVQQITYKDFDELTQGYKPSGIINTRIKFPDFTDFESAYKKLGNGMMDLMDRQVNGILRQPAVMITYLKLRKNYAGIETAYYRKLLSIEKAKYAKKLKSDPGYIGVLSDRVTKQTEKHFSELVMNEAADTVLKFADNPSIRSNFAVSVRTVGRFYRATEDFWRRLYRMKDVSPNVLYRMRLGHLGLESSGMFHKDQDGNDYIMVPMDNIIYKATDTTIRALTPGTDNGYKEPMFNDFTFKVNNINPSFSPDSGLPLLSGPIAALSVLGMKNLISNVPIPGAERAAADLDNYALGNLGDNMDITRALVPASIAKLWSILPVNEKTRQEVTAAQQAIAYNAAHGRFLNPNSTDQEKYDYLKNVRISAHNVIALRSILGMISPVAPSLQESKDVPDYLLDVGITGLRNEFWDIFESVQKKYGDDVQDPYELALSIFTGKHPGKIVYTVARDEKQTKVLITKTKQMQDWALMNKKFIGMYGEAAFIFGPHTGDFNSGVYNWLQSADLLKDKDIQTYYDDVMVAEDKQKYYDIAKWEAEQLGTQTYVSERRKVIQTATAAREGLLASNPLLLAAITGGGNEIATEEGMLQSLKQIVIDEASPVDAGLRMKMKSAIQAMEDFMAFSKDESVKNLSNAPALKRQYRDNVENIINQLSTEDPALKEAARAIFNSILKYYSRDTYKAVA